MDGIGEGSTCSHGGCAQAGCAECGLCCRRKFECRSYVTVKATFGFGLESGENP